MKDLINHSLIFIYITKNILNTSTYLQITEDLSPRNATFQKFLLKNLRLRNKIARHPCLMATVWANRNHNNFKIFLISILRRGLQPKIKQVYSNENHRPCRRMKTSPSFKPGISSDSPIPPAQQIRSALGIMAMPWVSSCSIASPISASGSGTLLQGGPSVQPWRTMRQRKAQNS